MLPTETIVNGRITEGGSVALAGGKERQYVHDIFTRWPRSGVSSGAGEIVLERILEFLAWAEIAEAPPPSRYLRLNAQISVDTAAPHQLRLTLDPFPSAGVSKERLAAVLRATGCRPLLERTLGLYERDGPLPQSYWVGLAPGPAASIVKGYIASYDAVCRHYMSHHAREAGWFPAHLEPAFVAVYDRLIPSFAALDGIGISFSGDDWLGTTLYLRATAPWAVCASAEFSGFLGISPAPSIERLSRALVAKPSFFGWSIELDRDGALVDIKLECAITQPLTRTAVATYARDFGIDSTVFDELARAIADAALSAAKQPPPAIMSLRFISGELRSLVSYFPLSARADT